MMLMFGNVFLLFMVACQTVQGVPMPEPEPDVNVNIKININGNDNSPITGKAVKASFKVNNEEFDEKLRNLNSPEYSSLKRKVEELIAPALKKNLGVKVSNFAVEFFRNGSESVIVDSTVTTTEQNQKVADKMVSRALIASGVSSVSVGVRLCVPIQDTRVVQAACAMMKQDNTELDITCVQARDRYECLQMAKNREVDLVRGNAADVYLAKELFGTDLSVVASTNAEDKINEPYQRQSVAVVRRSTITNLDDLKGKKSCHTGYGKTDGWHVPFSKLLDSGKMDLSCSDTASVVENDLRTVSSFFGEACIPGKWVPDNETNAKLKSEYNSLCKLCGNPGECNEQDVHAGYQGALQCLVDSNADVAWTTHGAVRDFFNSKPAVKGDFGLLCVDGTILDVDSTDACYWAAIPWPAWLTRAVEEDKSAIVSVLKDAMETAVPVVTDSPPKNWAKDVLGIDTRSAIKDINPRLSPNGYLNKAGYGTTLSNMGCQATPVRLCVNSQIENKKCTELAAVLKSRRVRPGLACVFPNNPDDCIAAVAKADADIVTLDGGDMFNGYTMYKTKAVISEVYGVYDASYFAVAVVRADSGITSLAGLSGKKSCHTGIEKTAGWKIPVVTLLEAGLITKGGDCDYANRIGTFFSESCAPGAKLPKYDPSGTNPASLCNLCVGDEDSSNKCARDPAERYYSYTGAFRCLVEGGGDVAFIKHTTVPDNTNGNSNQTWNKNIKSTDFKLLCKNTGTQEVVDFENCNLARVPSHKVVTGPNSTELLQEEIRIMLLKATETLPLGQDAFAMFGDYGSYRDILFKSSATSLVNLPEDAFNKLLESTYFKALTELESCSAKH